MSERMKFIGRLLDGEKMTDLCSEFEISRKTGYKIYNRYLEEGISGIEDRSKRPLSRPNQTSPQIEKMILNLRTVHPTWGAPKIKEYLQRKNQGIQYPAISTIHTILEKNNLIKKPKRNMTKFRATGSFLRNALGPNDLWCADFKGQFRLKNKMYCYPLTITDQFSRFLIACEGLENIKQNSARPIFERAFRENGLPKAIRTDNGAPFSTRSLYGLSELSIWWIRLGIEIERIEPGHPEQNGRHERMHRTLKLETIKKPAKNLLSQQERFDDFQELFNNERPHQALKFNCPQDLYKKSKNKLIEKLPDLEYPDHNYTKYIGLNGVLHLWNKKSVYLGKAFKGQNVGIAQVEDKIWKVSFMHYDLGFFDEIEYKLSENDNPFIRKVLPMSPE